MLKRAGLIVLIVVLFAVMFIFTALNTGQVELDLGFSKNSYPISVAIVVTFVCGVIFGMMSMVAFVLRLIRERRALRRALEMSQSEVTSLRSLPLSDAD